MMLPIRVLGLACCLAAALTTAAPAEDLKPFKFGISAPIVTIFPAYVAQAHHIFEKHGLKVDIVNMEGGSRGIQVLLSGEIQAMSVGVAPVVQANVEGADIRTVAATANSLPITFFAQSKFKTPADLKGANFGISTFGSETDFAVSLALKKWGMSRSDIQISQVGGTTQRYAALLAGRLDIAPLIEPAITQAKQKGTFTAMLDLAAAKIPWMFDSVVVTKKAVTDNADGIQRFLKGYMEGAYLAASDPAKAKAVITQRWKTQDPVVIEATYADFKRLVPLDLEPSIDAAKNVLAELAGFGIKIKSNDVADYVDPKPLADLKASGFMAEMQKTYGVK